jgi:hypothetical protein
MTDGKLFEGLGGKEGKPLEDELVLVVMNDRGVLKWKKCKVIVNKFEG